jgi:hypothetical protein
LQDLAPELNASIRNLQGAFNQTVNVSTEAPVPSKATSYNLRGAKPANVTTESLFEQGLLTKVEPSEYTVVTKGTSEFLQAAKASKKKPKPPPHKATKAPTAPNLMKLYGKDIETFKICEAITASMGTTYVDDYSMQIEAKMRTQHYKDNPSHMMTFDGQRLEGQLYYFWAKNPATTDIFYNDLYSTELPVQYFKPEYGPVKAGRRLGS